VFQHTLMRTAPVAALALCAACATNPVTGDTQLSLISESQEIEMGRQAAEEAAASIGLVEDQALQDYVQRIGESLARDSERPNLPWTCRVVADPTPNAFALPGGYIFVTRGLLGLMRSESELASVLGHEIGHVTAKHSVTMLSRAQITQLGLGIGAILSPTIARLSDVAGAGMQLLFLKYGRDAERQADDLGYKYALADNYDVRRMPNVFASLARVGEASGESPLPAWLATHPYPEERIQRIQQKLAELPATQGTNVGVDPYLARIDNLVYGENPRAGFFQDGLFLHPDLRFRLQFPQGWQTQNLTQSVTGMSGQQDAIVQLTIAEGSESQAASQFFQAQGIASQNVGRTTIHGNSAVTGYFQAQLQDGSAVGGLAAFISYGGNTYQILAYTPAQNLQRYDATFRSVVGSFQQLTDPQALNVRPNRIDVVRVPSAMTLAEFNRRYPSTIPIEELALINQVEGADSRIGANQQVKRVVAS